jgi:hypothetical protein
MRHQKGNEEAYIQASLKECRREIKGKDIGKEYNLKVYTKSDIKNC